MNAVTYKGAGKVMRHHNKKGKKMGKEERTDGEGFICKISLLAKGEHTSQEFLV